MGTFLEFSVYAVSFDLQDFLHCSERHLVSFISALGQFIFLRKTLCEAALVFSPHTELSSSSAL
jgi:hypothetical protein